MIMMHRHKDKEQTSSTIKTISRHHERERRGKKTKQNFFMLILITITSVVLLFGLSLTLMSFTFTMPMLNLTDHNQMQTPPLSVSLRSSRALVSIPLATEAQLNLNQQIRESICKEAMTQTRLKDWKHLCLGHFVETATQLLMNGDQINVVQIGAHTGFEQNDPIARGLSGLLDKVTETSTKTKNNELRKNFHWTFVEPSPANFKRLASNMLSNSNVCDMKSINAAVVSDLVENPDEMIFYSIRDTIDPETGFDSLSRKKFPHWITQVSSFSKEPILANEDQFAKHGLDVNDYIVETNVSTVSFSDLMKEALHVPMEDKKRNEVPFLVLIDTEGFDCAIIEGISPSSPFLPKYLVFEHKTCNRKETFEHLQNMGYSYRTSSENTVAIRND